MFNFLITLFILFNNFGFVASNKYLNKKKKPTQ